MRLNRLEEAHSEPRFDSEMLREAAALAHRLQENGEGLLTAEQMEAIGEEAGLGPTFLRTAMQQLALQRSEEAERSSRQQEFRNLAAGWGACSAFALLAWLVTAANPSAAHLMTLLLPVLLAPAIGFLIGKPRTAAAMSVVFAPALALVFAFADQTGPSAWLSALAFLAVGGPLGATLSWLGAAVRSRFFPPAAASGEASARAVLDLLALVHRQHQQQVRREAYLSIGVTPARETQRSAPPERVAATYERCREWVREIVRECGGECEESAGDELGAVFSANGAAVSAARRLQERVAQFNADRNRLAVPFRVRCGITAGESLGSEEPLAGLLRKRLMTLATELQQKAEPGDILVSAEMTAAALMELRSLAPLPLEPGAAPVFSWRAGQRAGQRP